MNQFLTQLTLNYGDICHTETVGFSGEGRAIRALKIGTFDGSKPIMFFEAGLHPREWIAPMVALYTMERMVLEYHSLSELQFVDVIIIPVTNPDGYEYTHNFVGTWDLIVVVVILKIIIIATSVEENKKYNY